MIRSAFAVSFSAVLGLVLSANLARGQVSDGPEGTSRANIDGFSVLGKGTAAAKPNRLEIDLEVSASSELSADAIVKYRDAKKRLQDAFSTLKLSNVAVEERGLLIDQKGQTFNPYYMDMPPARKGKLEVQLKRKLVVSVSNIRSMDEEALLQLVAKLLDVAQDAGGMLGGGAEFNPYYYRPNPMGGRLVRFVLDDFETLEEKAYGEAIADARAKARRLARLSGVQLGRVAGVREVLVPGEKAPDTGRVIYYYEASGREADEEVPRKRLESSRFQEIPVRVELLVRFDLAGPAKTDKGGAK
ncbi:MAG: SIMPL domain-containing protein [Isosphaeraceae bacterium]